LSFIKDIGSILFLKNGLKKILQKKTIKRISEVKSLASQKALNFISLVSINFMKHKKEDIQFYILLPYSLNMLNLHICASSE
jgi:hypothetical protein